MTSTSGEEELGAQMASVRGEWAATVDEMSTAPSAVLPAGMTRAEFKEWKALQTEKAKARLQELEERLKRLQLLEGKMHRLKTSSNNAIDAVPDHWTLPGTADDGFGSEAFKVEDYGDGPRALAHLEAQGAGKHELAVIPPNGYYNDGIEHKDAENTRPMYARPISPSVIRQIIREELGAAAESTYDANPRQQEGAESAVNFAADVHSFGDGHAQNVLTGQEVAARKAAMLRQASWMNSAQLDEMMANEARQAEEPDVEREPKSIEESVAISCPLIFGGFSRRSPVRQQCFDIKQNLWWQSFFLGVTVANSLYIAIAPEISEGGVEALKHNPSPGEFWFDIICAAVMGFEVLVGIIAYGFVQSKRTYLRNSGFHKLDFACFIATVLEYVGNTFNMPDFTMRPFRMLRLFKPLVRIKSFSGVKNIITTLSEGSPQLAIIFLFLLLTVAAWTILGMAVYSTSFRFRCVAVDADVPLCASNQINGNFGPTCNFTFDRYDTVQRAGGATAVTAGYPYEQMCDIVGMEAMKDADGEYVAPTDGDQVKLALFKYYKAAGKLYRPNYYDKTGSSLWDYANAYPKDKYGRWHTCQRAMFITMNITATTMCEEVGNPMGGYSHFDNFWGAFCTIFQVVVPDSYYDVWYRMFDSEPVVKGVTGAFLFFVNIFDTFLLLGLFVAVVTGTFKRVRDSHRNHHSAFITAEDEENMLHADQEKEQAVKRHDAEEDISGEEAMQYAALDIVQSSNFVSFISLTIVMHLVAMALDSYDAVQVFKDFGRVTNLVCSIIFILEVTLNYIAAGGLNKFWSKLFHQFELFLVVISIVGLLTNIPVFRLIPALRGYRLMKYFPTLEDMLKSAVSSVQAILNVFVFILLVMLCFVVAARYMFGSRLDPLTRSNFGTFAMASLSMFQLLTGDSWSGIMYNSMLAFSDDQQLAQFFGAVLVLTWFVFASLIATNLFVAVIIENFQISDTIENIRKPGRVAAFRSIIKGAYSGLYRKSNGVLAGNLTIDTNTGLTHPVQATRYHLLNMRGGARALYTYDEVKDKIHEAQDSKKPNTEYHSNSEILNIVEGLVLDKPEKQEDDMEDEPERVLFCLMPNNPIRLMFLWIARQALFDTIIYISILVSCFFLIVERPYPDMVEYPGQIEHLQAMVPISADAMKMANTLFTFAFTVEFFCRVMAQGLIFTKNAYLKSGWNIVDTVVLVFAWIEEMVDGPSYKALRMGRALKPLRLMKRNESMRVVIDALISTLQPLVYVILFLLFTLVVFSLIAMGLFGGKLHSCDNPAVVWPMGKSYCSHLRIRDDGIVMPSVWEKPYTFNFDNYADAIISLLQVSTFKYVAILYACMDVTDVNVAPKVNNSVSSAIFFAVYIFFGGLFVMNLFVGFIIDGFNANKGSSNEEMIYGRFRRQLYASRPRYETFRPPSNRYSTGVRKLFESPLFQSFSTICVVINVFFLLADNADVVPGSNYDVLLSTQNMVFFGELSFEVVLMAIGYGIGGFYNDPWKGLDLFVCLGQSAGLIAENPRLTNFAKVFRLFRVVRLAARIKSVRVILETFAHTVPQLTNIMLLIFLFYSMAAVMFVSFFATTRNGQRLGPTAKFEDYPSALLTIFHIVTGDEWHVLMIDLSVQPPFCDLIFNEELTAGYSGPPRQWGDCGLPSAPAFFLIVKLVCEYMLLNLFIGLILDNFSYITEDVGHMEDAAWSNGPSSDQLDTLCEVFKLYDHQSSFIPITSLHMLMCDLPLPLGYRKSDGKLRFRDGDRSLEILIRAELNLAMRHDAEMAAVRDKHWTRRMGLVKKEAKKRYINAVGYEILMVTLLHWRVPKLVPALVKWQRQERLEECALVAHALQCVEFFRMLVGRRKRRKIGQMLAKRSRFMHWSEHDPHRKRRNVHMLDKKMQQKDIALAQKRPILHLLNTPVETHTIVFEWLLVDDIPHDMLDHSRAAREHLSMRVPQPVTGIEVFRQKVSAHYIVMQLIDPNNKDPMGDLLMADMTRIQWRGWNVSNSKHESYYEPCTWAGVDNHHHLNPKVGWDRIDLYMLSKSQERRRQRRLGSIEEMQSYVIDDPHSTAKRAADRARSHLRLNLGNHIYASDKVKMQANIYSDRRTASKMGSKMGSNMEKISQTASYLGSAIGDRMKGVSSHGEKAQNNDIYDISGGDAVLEVVGYIPIQGFIEHSSMPGPS